MKYSIGYVTFKNKKQAEQICKVLLDEKLIACANIFKPHTAMYEWNRKTIRSSETAALIKTKSSLTKKVAKRIQALHSYEVPCVVFWPFTTPVSAFTKWISAQTL